MHTYDGSIWSRGLPSFLREMPVRHGPTPRYMVCTSNDSCFCCHDSKKHETKQQAQQHEGEHWQVLPVPNSLQMRCHRNSSGKHDSHLLQHCPHTRLKTGRCSLLRSSDVHLHPIVYPPKSSQTERMQEATHPLPCSNAPNRRARPGSAVTPEAAHIQSLYLSASAVKLHPVRN